VKSAVRANAAEVHRLHSQAAARSTRRRNGMAQFVAMDAKVEVNGETVLSIVDGMGAFSELGRQILKDCGIDKPAPGRWYRQQSWLDAFRLIAESVGPRTLFNIGAKIPQNAIFPPQIDSIDKALAAIDVAYHMNHRGGDIGAYRYLPATARGAMMVCDTPYPCDFDQGIIDAMAQRFKPPKAIARVQHDNHKACRKTGAKACTYHVSW
jgi:hypothetical protein